MTAEEFMNLASMVSRRYWVRFYLNFFDISPDSTKDRVMLLSIVDLQHPDSLFDDGLARDLESRGFECDVYVHNTMHPRIPNELKAHIRRTY